MEIKMKPDTHRPSQPCIVQMAPPPQRIVKKNELSCNFFLSVSFVSIVSDSVGAIPPSSAKRSAFILNFAPAQVQMVLLPGPISVLCRVGGTEGVLWACFKFANM